MIDRTEDAPEEKQVTDTDALLSKVALRDPALTERWLPAGVSMADVLPEVRVEVGAIVAPLDD